MFQFLHAADLHLDSPLTGLARYEGLPADEIRNASRLALDRLVNCAVERGVRFVILAGDIYDGSWRDAATGLYFASRMARLRQAGILVYLIQGNHDAESVMAKSIRLPENVHVFSGRRAGSAEVPDVAAVVHGRSFATRATETNLAVQYPARVEGRFNIGVLHTSLSGFEGHDSYAPCSLDDLASKGYDYWALGHVHNGQILSRAPYVVYPGNLQGRNIRETGPKGAYLVTVDDGLRVEDCGFVALGSFQWRRLDVDLSGCASVKEMHARWEDAFRELRSAEPDDSPLIVRVRLTGATALQAMLQGQTDWKLDLRALATDVGAEQLWLEKIELDLAPVSAPLDLTGPMSELTEAIQRAASDPEIAAKADLQPLLQKLPDDVRGEVAEWLRTDGPRYRRLLEEVESMLLTRLAGQGGAQ
ncbi:DNA repair exonuclease [uncultured Paludibaculum sp.]|uniref:metallophosphoesterase family protein n=1 Tax=uncultured Paludibaculum sp. TaxID=1765020 RepID=UPI002AAB26EB|nr:DNA repair exonuclease [uncultured Paludibaculum sp.]